MGKLGWEVRDPNLVCSRRIDFFYAPSTPQLGLASIDVISTISGGSITGAAYCLRTGSVEDFLLHMKASLLRCSVVGYVLRSGTFLRFAAAVLASGLAVIGLLFTTWAPLSLPLLVGLILLLLKFQFRLLPISHEVEKAYEAFFFHGYTLLDLPATPLLAIGASNLQTGRPFTFSRTWMGDSTYTYRPQPVHFTTVGFPVARAVTASSCVPFAFTPVPIANHFFQNPADAALVEPQLIDGGVYDNQGLQKLTQAGSRYECTTIVVSDAGAGLGPVASYSNTLTLLLRTVNLFMNRIKNAQMMANLFQPATPHSRCVAYLSLGWELKNSIPGFVSNLIRNNISPAVLAARQLPAEWVAEPRRYREAIEEHLKHQVGYDTLASRDLTPDDWRAIGRVGTSLTPLATTQLELLMRHAENLTELQIKLYWP